MVTGPTPSATSNGKMYASAPPQNEIGTRPSSASVTRWARVTVNGCNARPDMYMLFSLGGKIGRWLRTSSVLDSFNPNARPDLPAASRRLRTICIASLNLGSCSNAASSTTTSKPMCWLRIPRSRSGPSSVGLSLTHVSIPRSSSMNRAMRSISAGGHPCIVERVTRFERLDGIRMSRTEGTIGDSASTTDGSCSLASRIRRKNLCTFSDLMPSRS